MKPSIDIGTEGGLLSIPHSTFLHNVCPFLQADDLLYLRLSSKGIHNVLHGDEESETFWQYLLERDFGIESAQNKKEGWNQVLNVKFPNPQAIPIFGVDPAADDFILTIHSEAFHVWRYWLKADLRLISPKSPLRQACGGRCIHAPFFLRAAHFWQNILRWCDIQESVIGRQVRNSLRPAYENFPKLTKLVETHSSENPGKTSCGWALLALYSFTSGQGIGLRAATPFDGLFGGYHAYGYYSCMCLTEPQHYGGLFPMLTVAFDFIGERQGMEKKVMLNLQTGRLTGDDESASQLCVFTPPSERTLRGHNIPSHQDDILNYFEEYARRLSTGYYRVGLMGTHEGEPIGISLFPHLPLSESTSEGSNSTASSDIPVVSRSITRSIEVMGSSVFAREGEQQFGYIYCIRIRLLTPGEDGYQSPEERGFGTCQLQSRHWTIKDDETRAIDEVDGQGVIGMYPLLHEGGYTLSGQSTNDTFQYQSCTGRKGKRGSFGGRIQFVPGSLHAPQGPPFMAELGDFLLDSQPDFLF